MSEYEKKSLIKFLALYLGSALVFITIIATVVYSSKVENLQELQKQKLKNFCSIISTDIIDSHMRGMDFNIPKSEEFSFALIDSKNEIIFSNLGSTQDIATQGFYERDGRLGIVDSGPRLHHGIKYIVAEEHSLAKQKQEAFNIALYIWFAATASVCILGITLSKQFLKPLRIQMQKIDDFVKASTHELNTPITSLILSLDTLKNEVSDKTKLESLKTSAKAISKIYDDLTYYIQKESIKKEDEWIDIGELAADKIAIYSKIAKTKNITFRQDIGSFLFKIDKTAATRLIDNLISNAVKYSKANGEIAVTVKEHLVEIADNGVGIDEASKDSIFQKFKRATTSGGGFGLGLYIVKSICDDYKIDIDLKSEKEKGSSFTLHFPKNPTLLPR